MAENVDAFQIKRMDDVANVLGETVNFIAMVWLVGFAMAAHVERDHPVPVAQPLDLMLELLGRLRPAGNHQQRLTRAGFQIMKAHAIADRYATDESGRDLAACPKAPIWKAIKGQGRESWASLRGRRFAGGAGRCRSRRRFSAILRKVGCVPGKQPQKTTNYFS